MINAKKHRLNSFPVPNAKNIDYLMWIDHHCKILSISSTETQKNVD